MKTDSSYYDVKSFILAAGYKVEGHPARSTIYVKGIKNREEGIQLSNLIMANFHAGTPLWTNIDKHFGLTVYVSD